MNRRAFFAQLGVAVLATPLAAEGQPAGKIAKIGFLGNGSASPHARRLQAFQQGLRDLGYVEGNTVAVEYRWSEGKQDRLPQLATELVRLKVDLIVTHSTPGIRAAKQATTTIPIVMAGSFDPVGNGLVASLARPGGNVTGLSLGTGDGFGGKWLQLLKEAVPSLSSVAVLWNRANPGIASQVNDIQSAARTAGVHVQLLDFHGADQIERALAAMAAARPDGLIVPSDATAFMHRARIIALVAKSRLPTIYPTRESVDDGGLMAYAPSQTDMYCRAALYVDKILKGAKPGDLPIEQPTKFDLAINLKTARALGLKIPQSILVRADQVIE